MSFDERISRGLVIDTAITLMAKKEGTYNPKILELLKNIKTVQDYSVTKSLMVEELTTEMMTLEEIRSSNGMLLVPKYQEITQLILQRLARIKLEMGVKEPIPVAMINE